MGCRNIEENWRNFVLADSLGFGKIGNGFQAVRPSAHLPGNRKPPQVLPFQLKPEGGEATHLVLLA